MPWLAVDSVDMDGRHLLCPHSLFAACIHGRALRRWRERADFWFWLLRYRLQSRPILIEAIKHATQAQRTIEKYKKMMQMPGLVAKPAGRMD